VLFQCSDYRILQKDKDIKVMVFNKKRIWHMDTFWNLMTGAENTLFFKLLIDGVGSTVKNVTKFGVILDAMTVNQVGTSLFHNKITHRNLQNAIE
jgi:uncharacterized membrane protein